MKPQFSEFSYGYSITEELVKLLPSPLIAAPIFPSLYEECQEGGGYDVKLPFYGMPLFLQFKVSHIMKRPSAKESDILGIPYYRMPLMSTRHSEQHNLLLDLETKYKSVFYIAPEFHSTSELNAFYLNREVIENSAAFSPLDIGPLDEDDHYVAFKAGDPFAYLCSENPKKIEKNKLSAEIGEGLQSDWFEERLIDDDFLRILSEDLLGLLTNADQRLRERE
jgi:hypothetical protein